MPTHRIRCLKCKNDYTAYIYKEPGMGHTLLEYPCPACGSLRKGLLKGRTIEEIKGFSSVGKTIEQKSFLKQNENKTSK